MGLFGDDTENDQANSLAANSRGNSVTADRLTKTSSGLMQPDLLDTDPVITFLQSNEQPEFFFYNDTKGITRNGTTVGDNDSSFRSLCVVTDKRILFFTAGSKGEFLPLDAITGVETSIGRMKNRLTVTAGSEEFTFYISNSIDDDEVTGCEEFIGRCIEKSDTTPESEATSTTNGLSSLWDSQLDETPSAKDALDAEPQGGYVTKSRYDKVKGILDPGEKVHFITQGSTVDVEGSSAGSSLFGDDRSRKSGTRGWVRAVITDKRIAVKIPQMLGTDERSVPYNSITSVDLDTGLVNKRLTLQTPGQTYHIEAQDPGKDEVRRAIRYIRQKVDDANQPDVVQQPGESEPDPLDQIEKLKQLHDSGAISEEEFKEKKQNLLDKI